jgi:hypothetical protein
MEEPSRKKGMERGAGGMEQEKWGHSPYVALARFPLKTKTTPLQFSI